MEINNTIDMINNISPGKDGIDTFVNFIGGKVENVPNIGERVFDNVYQVPRPNNEGLYSYISYNNKLTCSANSYQFNSFFKQLNEVYRNGHLGEAIDFFIVVGNKRVIVFDSSNSQNYLDLTYKKLNLQNSKYKEKLYYICFNQIKDKYVKDFFGEISLKQGFKNELFRFSINSDENFPVRTRLLREELLKHIVESKSIQNIITEDVVYKKRPLNYLHSSYDREIISSVIDTLVLRQMLLRILEGRFGYDPKQAYELIKNVGLGNSFDDLLSKNIHLSKETEDNYVNNNKHKSKIETNPEQLNLFDGLGQVTVNEANIYKVRSDVLNYQENKYSGDLYVGSIAKAATDIENSLNNEEWSKMWHFLSTKNFTFDLSDVTPGTIGEQYEQSLSNTLKISDGKLIYEKNNTAQKDSGSFYTNSYIVDYIVTNTIDKVILGKINKLENASISRKNKILKSIFDLKIADITSGGGTFLSCALEHIGRMYNKIVEVIDINKYKSKYPQLRDTYSLKKYAAEHMIYGIDTNLKALIVSSFGISLELLNKQEGLPTLINKNLIHRDSLVSFINDELISQYKSDIISLKKERKKYLNNKNNSFLQDRNKLQNIFVTNLLSSKQYNESQIREAINDKHMGAIELDLPEIFFDDKGNKTGGFDIIVGNPPYFSLKKIPYGRDIYNKIGKFYSYGKSSDIYVLFYERSTRLLNKNGVLGLITSNQWIRANYGKKIRQYFLTYVNPNILINLGSNMFSNASVDTNILILTNQSYNGCLKVLDLSKNNLEPIYKINKLYNTGDNDFSRQKFNDSESWIILNNIEQSIKEKVTKYGDSLSEWNINMFSGINTSADNAFIINKDIKDKLISEDQNAKNIIWPILRGKDIYRNRIKDHRYVINTHNGYKNENGKYIPRINIDDYPSIKRWLSMNWYKNKYPKNKLNDKDIKKKVFNQLTNRTARGDTPFNLRSLSHMSELFNSKILYPDIVKYPRFFFDKNGDYFQIASAFAITGDNLNYLVQWLNSYTVSWIYKTFYAGGNLNDNSYRCKKAYMELLPIPKPDDEYLKHPFKITDEYIYSRFHFTSEEIKYIKNKVRKFKQVTSK